MRVTDEQEFREFVGERLPAMRRLAFLLCGDRHLTDDLVSTAVLKVYRNWRRVRRADQPAAYVRAALVNVWLDECRRPWRRELPAGELPEPAVDGEQAQADRLTLLALLDQLTPARRAVIVLRYYEGFGVEETARLLGIAAGTVKAHTHHALAHLRALLEEPDGDAVDAIRR